MSHPIYSHQGTRVVPLPGTIRRIAGGTCVDVRVTDPRSTITFATVNARNVVDDNGRPLAF